ncbi:MAG: LAGLIDADG family homing endonuclease [Candidatus Aenigmatarchaeota archaeon]
MEREEIVEKFAEFLREYYYNELVSAASEGKKSLVVDFSLLDKFNPELASYLLDNPEEVLSAAEESLKQIDLPGQPSMRIRIFNLPEERQIRIRNIRAEHIGKLISVDGIVKRASEIRPEVYEAVFQCSECGSKITVLQTERFIKPPNECECGNRRNFKLVDQKLYDARWITIEEPFEITSGERPSEIMVFLKEDLTSPKMQNKTDPGNRIKVVGILKQIPRRVRGTRSRQLEIYIDANSVESVEVEWEELEITPEDEKRILELAKDPEIYSKLVASIAPSLYGMEEIKEAIVLQLFGGEPHIQKDKSRVRGDIHILLVGDPSTAKSALMKVVATLIPRGRYVSGKGVTAAGLTATVVRDEEFLGGWVLEAGALVMCNKSLCAIDEFEKVEKSDQIALHEAMEQQSYHKDTKILLSDGREVKIGELVNGLIERNKDKVINGNNCEILNLNGEIKVFTTDFEKIYESEVKQVSRHKAGKYMIKISFSNGREIVVTPEHPIWILTEDGITTVRAESLKSGSYVPVPKILPIKGMYQNLIKDRILENFPSYNDKKLSKYTVNLLTDGGYELDRRKKNSVNFNKSDENLIKDFSSISCKLFGLAPYVQNRLGKTTTPRIISLPLSVYLNSLDASIWEESENKKIPETFMKTSNNNIREMLRAMFECGGYVGKNRVEFVSPSKELCEQIQTLLLMFRIQSRIFRESLPSRKNFFRLSITGIENLKRFKEKIGFISKRKNSVLNQQLKLSKKISRDVIPNVGKRISKIAKNLKIKESKVLGHSITSIKKGKLNISRANLQKFVLIFEKKIFDLEKQLYKISSAKNISELKKIRKRLSISQEDIAKTLGLTHQHISYWEKTSTNLEKYREGLKNVIDKMLLCKEEVIFLKKLAFGEIAWVTVKKVQKIKCEDEWVYDITVEPTKTFVSECLILHNSISIAKASIVATLPAQTAILAGGNPKLGRFDPYLPIKEQIDVPETLLSRFDLKFALRDIPNPELDAKVAEHILKSRHYGEEEIKPVIEPEFLKKYIAYARKNCHPKLSKEAGEEIKNFFVSLREKAAVEETAVPITLRQYEALIRLAEASAKVQLRDVVTREDAIRAIKLMKASLREFGFEAETGRFDVDRLEGRTTASERGKIRIVLDIIEELSKTIGNTFPKEDVIRLAKDKGLKEFDVEKILTELKNKGDLFEPRTGFLQKM